MGGGTHLSLDTDALRALLLAALAVAAVLVALYLNKARRFDALRARFEGRVSEEAATRGLELFDTWKEAELTRLQNELGGLERQRAWNELQAYKQEFEAEIRRDAVARSDATTRGRISENIAPYLPGFNFEARDARFLGSPIDFVVFDGLHENECHRVVLVEVKSGSSNLSTRERRVRDAVLEGRVEWREIFIDLEDSE